MNSKDNCTCFGKHIKTIFIKKRLTKEQRQEKRFIKQQEKEFRQLFRKAKAKLKKAAMTKAIRIELIEDLEKCNNIEIMHYLATTAEFGNDHQYLNTVNGWLSLETKTYNYALDKYNGSNFESITSEIIKRHKYLALKAKFIKPLEENE